MTSLTQDVEDVISVLDDLGAMFLLSPRHMRTKTGCELLEGVQKLRAKIFDLTREVQRLKSRDAEFDSQRSVIDRLTAELEIAQAPKGRCTRCGGNGFDPEHRGLCEKCHGAPAR